MKRTYWYYSFLCIFITIGLVWSIVIFLLSNALWVQILTIIAFTFFRMQVGFLSHDLSHNQVFKNKKYNSFFAYIGWGLISWVSQDYWTDKHNSHHNTTNQNGGDPDVDLPFLLSPNQSYSDHWFFRKCIVPYQHILFFLSLPLIYMTLVIWSYIYIFKNRKTTSYLEFIFITSNIIAIIMLMVHVQWVLTGMLFVLGHFLLAGLYMSLSFAPNHMWKEIIPEDIEYERIFQITSSRNINPSFLGTLIFWSLDYQIEHHLYPTMPRKNYKKVWPMVQEFCEKHGIQYSQTSFIGSMKEIYMALKANAKG